MDQPSTLKIIIINKKINCPLHFTGYRHHQTIVYNKLIYNQLLQPKNFLVYVSYIQEC